MSFLYRRLSPRLSPTLPPAQGRPSGGQRRKSMMMPQMRGRTQRVTRRPMSSGRGHRQGANRRSQLGANLTAHLRSSVKSFNFSKTSDPYSTLVNCFMAFECRLNLPGEGKEQPGGAQDLSGYTTVHSRVYPRQNNNSLTVHDIQNFVFLPGKKVYREVEWQTMGRGPDDKGTTSFCFALTDSLGDRTYCICRHYYQKIKNPFKKQSTREQIKLRRSSTMTRKGSRLGTKPQASPKNWTPSADAYIYIAGRLHNRHHLLRQDRDI